MTFVHIKPKDMCVFQEFHCFHDCHIVAKFRVVVVCNLSSLARSPCRDNFCIFLAHIARRLSACIVIFTFSCVFFSCLCRQLVKFFCDPLIYLKKQLSSQTENPTHFEFSLSLQLQQCVSVKSKEKFNRVSSLTNKNIKRKPVT